MVAARHLHNWGAEVSLNLPFKTSRLKTIPAHQWRILSNMGLNSIWELDLAEAELIVDALIGYGLSGDPRQPIAGLIDAANNAGKPILALDAPSGLDTTKGVPGNPCIKAALTLTLALPKTGLLTRQAKDFVGELYLADISVPSELYQHLGVEVPVMFAKDTILKVN